MIETRLPTLKIGDWIKFKYDDQIIVGEVISFTINSSGVYVYASPCGMVKEEEVIEVRSDK
jgi:hypothetical protein